nr:PREDICTED: eukaryotic translation initiation factor 2A [Bemisia tabaci]
MATSKIPCLAVRGSTGISINQGPPNYELVPGFSRVESKSCKAMLFSPAGKYFAWVGTSGITIVNTATWGVVAEIPKPKTQFFKFSPKETYLMSWEPFAVSAANPEGSPNLSIWRSETGELVKVFVHKKHTAWDPQWSSDEHLCARLINGAELAVYEDSNFDEIKVKSKSLKVANFALSPGKAPHHFVFYLPAPAGQPSVCRLYQYPNFDLSGSLAQKTFFQADKVDFFWNSTGKEVLILTSTEVDKTGASYYGKQGLFLLSIKGDSAMVLTNATGPVYSVAWNPLGHEFCVIYGLMPSKATMFNTKAEPVFEFGESPRNAVHFNPLGNIVLLGGFGNLPGMVETWDVKSHKLIAKSDAPDTTLLHWSPDGVHYMTATTAPRLRVNNGFRIWHYSGALLYERPWNKQEELWDVQWQSFPVGTFKTAPVSYKAVEGIKSSQPTASKQVYVPPSARNRAADGAKIGFGAVKSVEPSASAIKNKKKKESKKNAKQRQLEQQTVEISTPLTPANKSNKKPAAATALSTSNSHASNGNHDAYITDSDDPEKVKKIKKVKNKLGQITKLKELQSEGQLMNPNQLDKINKENDLIKELENLVAS